ncbi:MAG: hypothetical protein HY943_23560 [Gammaproteobacteria bacterium]|nr:hypothetical protein [Gammaproteobacteria bacterium]
MKQPGAAPQRRPRVDDLRAGDPPDFAFEPVATRALAAATRESTGRPKLVTVIAPVGYGKTVLLTGCYRELQRRGERCWWAALDDRDTTVERLLGRLETVTGDDGPDLHPTQALLRGEAPVDRRAEALLAATRELGGPVTVFIDNLDYCTDPGLGALLETLVFSSPPEVRFVLSSVHALPMNFARAKLEGLLLQLGAAELALDAAQTGALLGPEVCAAIGDDGIAEVARRTEGWPAAVRLAQIVLAGAPLPGVALQRFSGSDEDLAALLNQQVLAGFDPALREYLLGVAPLRTFSAELCRHALGDADAEAHLAYLLRHNVFLIPLDRDRTWYRLHGLFREYLLAEGRRTQEPALRTRVLERAAEWCAREGYRRDAIDYALAAAALPLAARLIEGVARTFVSDRGDLPQYIEWVEAMHAGGGRLEIEAEYWYAWALVLNRRYEAGRQQNAHLARWAVEARGRAAPGQIADIERRVEIISACVGIFTDRLDDAFRDASRWLATDDGTDPFDEMAAQCTQCIYEISALNLPAARLALQAAQGSAFRLEGAYTASWIALLKNLITIVEGDFAAACRETRAALEVARRTLGDSAGICGTLSLIAAKAAVETGRDDEAAGLLTSGLRISRSHGFVDAAACGADAALKLWPGTPDHPFAPGALAEFTACYPPRLAFVAGCHLVQRLLRLGRPDEAAVEAARIGLGTEDALPPALPAWADAARCRDLAAAAAIDLAIASGHTKRAAARIAEETRLAKAEGRYARLAELALAEVEIAVRSRDPASGRRPLTRAVTLAAPRGMVRTFRDRARPIADLVADTKPSAWNFALETERKFFAEICRTLPLGDPALQERLIALNMEAHLLEPLTARQIELLNLLAAGLTNQQLADRLGVTVTTVKGHLQKLYGKLGVASRAAALARGRALKLLA